MKRTIKNCKNFFIKFSTSLVVDNFPIRAESTRHFGEIKTIFICSKFVNSSDKFRLKSSTLVPHQYLINKLLSLDSYDDGDFPTIESTGRSIKIKKVIEKICLEIDDKFIFDTYNQQILKKEILRRYIVLTSYPTKLAYKLPWTVQFICSRRK